MRDNQRININAYGIIRYINAVQVITQTTTYIHNIRNIEYFVNARI